MPCSAWTTWSPSPSAAMPRDELVGALAACAGRAATAGRPADPARPGRCDAGGREAVLERQHGDARRRAAPAHLGQRLDRRQPVEAVVGQHLRQPLQRALAVGGEERPLVRFARALQMRDDGVEQVDRAVGPLGGEVARRPAAQIRTAAIPPGGRGGGPKVEKCQPAVLLDRPLEALLVEIEQLRRQRPVGGRAEAGPASGGCSRASIVLADQLPPGPRSHPAPDGRGRSRSRPRDSRTAAPGRSWNSGSQCSMPGKRGPALTASSSGSPVDGAELLQIAGLEALDRRRRRAAPRSPASARAIDLAGERWVSGSKARMIRRRRRRGRAAPAASRPVGKMSIRPPRTA